MTQPKNSSKPNGPDKHTDDDETVASVSRAYRELGPYLNLAWFFLAGMLLFGGVGWWADDRYGFDPWGKFSGVLLGIIVGFYNFFKVVFSAKNDGTGK